jgi:hypothetical protein
MLEQLETRRVLAPVISEFLASNSNGLQDENGDASDWIEIWNDGPTDVDLTGWNLTDTDANLQKWSFPATNLPVNSRLVVFASGNNTVGTGPNGEHHTNFQLAASGGYLALVQPDGQTVASQFTNYPEQLPDISFGIGSTTSQFLVADDAQGTATFPTDNLDGNSWTGGNEPYGDTVANGWQAIQQSIGYDEIGTVSGETIGNPVVNRANPDGANGSIFVSNGNPFTQSGPFTSWSMYSTNTRQITPLIIELNGGNYAIRGIGTTRTSDGSGEQSFDFDLVSGSDEVGSGFYFGWKDGSNGGNNPGVFPFDNGGGGSVRWFSTHTNFSVDESLGGGTAFARVYSFQATVGLDGFEPQSDVAAAMKDTTTSAYVRFPFDAPDVASIDSLQLTTKYDDGFVAYLNGTEISRRNVNGSPGFDTVATVDRDRSAALEWEIIDVSGELGNLVNGSNVLTIHGVNDAIASPDFFLQVKLSGLTTESNLYLPSPTPGEVNTSGLTGIVADTAFSIDRGFFDSAFDTQISSATPGATIVYTTDGSDPTLQNGTLVPSPTPSETPLATVNISETTTLRAAAFNDNMLSTNIDTHSYIFVDDVVQQPLMNTQITQHPTWGPQVDDALLAVPTISISTNSDISQVEAGVSFEVLYSDGRESIQVNAGAEHYGGHSLNSPKKNIRISFKSEYGTSRLVHPFFADGATDDFDQLLLRSGSHDNFYWVHPAGARGTHVRGRWAFDRQLEMGHAAPEGEFHHVYLNGVYHGQFHLMERPNAEFMASYFDGNASDYDALNAGTPIDGDAVRFNAMVNSSNDYQQVQQYMDVVNYADYLLLQFFGGNDWDWRPYQNWMAAGDRNGGDGFQFFAWDADVMLRSGSNANTVALTGGNAGGPGGMWLNMQNHDEFTMLMADQAQKYFFNDGMFTADRFRSDIDDLASEIELSFIAESARWGSGQYSLNSNEFFAPDVWQREIDRMKDWYGQTTGTTRAELVIQQLRAIGAFPSIDAPQLAINGLASTGELINSGDTLTITSGQVGTIYYTLDGTDPRLEGGVLSPNALVYSGGIALNSTAKVNTRLVVNNEWSALSEAEFIVNAANASNLAITEINYNPLAPSATELQQNPNLARDAFEFLELQNTSAQPIDLTNVRITDGVTFDFTNSNVTTLAPGESVVVVNDLAAFEIRYGSGLLVAGEYSQSLSNGGENISIVDATDTLIAGFSYSDDVDEFWSRRADGHGSSLVVVDTAGNYNDSDNWRPSVRINGTPAADAENPLNTFRINEVLSHTDLPTVDTIELLNLLSTPVDLQHHYLSDAASTVDSLAKFHVANSTLVQGNEFINFDESDFNPTPLNPGPNDFGLNSLGDQVYLTVGDELGPTHFVDDIAFNAAANGVSFIPHTTSNGRIYTTAEQTTTLTADQTNTPFLIGQLVISEIHYNPLSGSEFIEIHNRSNVSVDLFDPVHPLNTWQIDGIGFQFPTATTLAAGGVAIVSPLDPDSFRQEYNVDEGVQIFGPYSGNLNNGGERISLQRPDTPELINNETIVPFIDVDVVNFDDAVPWPVDADGLGESLQRLADDNFGSDPASWGATTISPGIASYQSQPISVVSIVINSNQQDPADLPKGSQPTSWINQRSHLADIRIVFSEPAVTVTPNELRLVNLGQDADNQPDVEFTLLPEHITHNGNVVTLEFAPEDLDEGVYSLEILDTIVDSQGQQLDGDDNGIAGGLYSFVGNNENRFYRLLSEYNGDFGVSVFDFSTFSYWFGQSVGVAPLYADMNIDGGVSVFDFTMFSLNFGESVAFPSAFAAVSDDAFARLDSEEALFVEVEMERDTTPHWQQQRRASENELPLALVEESQDAIVDLAIEMLVADEWQL